MCRIIRKLSLLAFVACLVPVAANSAHPSETVTANGSAFAAARPVEAHPLMFGAYHENRAMVRHAGLNAEEAARYEMLLDWADSHAERCYLMKAFAFGYDLDALEAFAGEIRGRDMRWLRDHLHLTASSRGRGVMQQWRHSCVPAMVQALRGEMDPIYALRVHQANGDVAVADNANPLTLNADLAREQRMMLEMEFQGRNGFGGKAVPRAGSARDGGGRWHDPFVEGERALALLSVAYERRRSYGTVDAALEVMDQMLAAGLPVPLVVGTPAGKVPLGGGAARNRPLNQHAVLAVGMERVNAKRVYTIHDPWTGWTTTRSEEIFRAETLNLSGNHRLFAVNPPAR
jgi:hypothetical protein